MRVVHGWGPCKARALIIHGAATNHHTRGACTNTHGLAGFSVGTAPRVPAQGWGEAVGGAAARLQSSWLPPGVEPFPCYRGDSGPCVLMAALCSSWSQAVCFIKPSLRSDPVASPCSWLEAGTGLPTFMGA